MSIFRSIMNGIFGRSPAATQEAAKEGAEEGPAVLVAAPDSAPDAPSGSQGGGQADLPLDPLPDGRAPLSAAPDSAPDAPSPAQAVDVVAILTALQAASGQTLNWRQSIVDLMKLLGIDSSLAARKELAGELGYTGSTDDTATMNVWLHRQVMRKLAENGGKVPEELKH